MSGSNEKRTTVLGTIALIYLTITVAIFAVPYFFWRWFVEVVWKGNSSDDFLNR